MALTLSGVTLPRRVRDHNIDFGSGAFNIRALAIRQIGGLPELTPTFNFQVKGR
jgi:hypothetical protein